MADDTIRGELVHEARALGRALKGTEIPIVRRLTIASSDSGYDGYFAKLATLSGSSRIELWYDYSSGREEPLYWAGLRLNSAEAQNSAIELASSSVKPNQAFMPVVVPFQRQTFATQLEKNIRPLVSFISGATFRTIRRTLPLLTLEHC